MLVFPQLVTGATVQYPLTKQSSQRTVQSAMEDQTIVTLPDLGARFVCWKIAFRDLADQEATSLQELFAATQGNLLPFLFLDPTANLLLWSEDFSQSEWNRSGIDVDSAVADPFGSLRAWRANNDTSSTQVLAQNTLIPGLVQTCFSVYLRGTTATTAALVRTSGGHTEAVAANVTSMWQRFHISGKFPALADPSRFGVSIPAGTSLELFGPQLDAQVTPSPYVVNAGSIGNVYPAARFDMNQIDVTSTGPNRNACVVSIRCNLPVGDEQ